jgi:Rho termination factor-like protein
MERDDYKKYTVSELRTEARRRGLKGVDRLRRDQLIERLSEAKTEAKSLVAKAKTLVKRVAERVTPDKTPKPEPAETLETETMARLYEEQGHVTQALAIYRRILDENSARTDLKERIDSLERRAAPPMPPQQIPPGQRQSMPSEPIGMLDFEELPELYGIDDCAVVPRDPWNLFVYWEVTPDGRAGARSRLGGEGHSARLVLRLYSVGVGPGGVAHEERDVDLDWDHGRRVISSPAPGVRVSIAWCRRPSPIPRDRWSGWKCCPTAAAAPNSSPSWWSRAAVPVSRRSGCARASRKTSAGPARRSAGAPARPPTEAVADGTRICRARPARAPAVRASSRA